MYQTTAGGPFRPVGLRETFHSLHFFTLYK